MNGHHHDVGPGSEDVTRKEVILSQVSVLLQVKEDKALAEKLKVKHKGRVLKQVQQNNDDQPNAGDQTPTNSEQIHVGAEHCGVAQSQNHEQVKQNPRLHYAAVLHFALLRDSSLQFGVFHTKSEMVELVVGLGPEGLTPVKVTNTLHQFI